MLNFNKLYKSTILEFKSVGTRLYSIVEDSKEFEEILTGSRTIPHQPILLLDRERLLIQIPVFMSSDVRGPCNICFCDSDWVIGRISKSKGPKLWSEFVIHPATGTTGKGDITEWQCGICI